MELRPIGTKLIFENEVSNSNSNYPYGQMEYEIIGHEICFDGQKREVIQAIKTKFQRWIIEEKT